MPTPHTPLTVLAGLLLRDDPSLDSAVFETFERWRATPYPERERDILAHLRFYLIGVSSLCPYYAESLSSELGRGQWDWARFRALPLTSRSTIVDHEESLYSKKEGCAWRAIGSTSTSGSTGTPIRTDQTPARVRLQRLLTRLWHKNSSREPSAHVGFITEPLVTRASQSAEGIHRGSWSVDGNGQAYGLSLLASAGTQLEFVNRRGLGILATYPSNLQSLLDESELRGVRPEALTHVILSSEPIADMLVERARQLWGVQVVGTYSSSELAAIALQDEYGVYRVQDCSVWVEVLDDEGQPTKDGEIGRVVVTTLQELRRPLIRYDVGDFAEISRTQEGELVLKRILGRERAMVHTKDGGTVWPYFELNQLAPRRVIRKWQLIQHRNRALTMRVEATSALQDGDRSLIDKAVAEMSGGLPLTIQVVDSIERTAGGKFQEVISEVGL